MVIDMAYGNPKSKKKMSGKNMAKGFKTCPMCKSPRACRAAGRCLKGMAA